MPKATILIVEYDTSLADVLFYNIRQAGYEILLARDGEDGLRQAQLKSPDLVVLDLMLPVIDGLQLCHRLRSDPATRKLLVLMLTAKSREIDEVVGFNVGADDYVTKPFSVNVLLERIKALIRRRETEQDTQDIIVNQEISVYRRRHRATAEGKPLYLTKSEFALLETLIRQPGGVFSRSELIDIALGDDALVLERTIDVHIRALRKKLGKHSKLIETVRGGGSRFPDERTAYPSA